MAEHKASWCFRELADTLKRAASEVRHPVLTEAINGFANAKLYKVSREVHDVALEIYSQRHSQLASDPSTANSTYLRLFSEDFPLYLEVDTSTGCHAIFIECGNSGVDLQVIILNEAIGDYTSGICISYGLVIVDGETKVETNLLWSDIAAASKVLEPTMIKMFWAALGLFITMMEIIHTEPVVEVSDLGRPSGLHREKAKKAGLPTAKRGFREVRLKVGPHAVKKLLLGRGEGATRKLGEHMVGEEKGFIERTYHRGTDKEFTIQVKPFKRGKGPCKPKAEPRRKLHIVELAKPHAA